jgi:hypothetical protein
VSISTAVRRYYAERIYARTDRAGVPPNFRLRDDAPTGIATVEGCRGGGKNILEIRLYATDRAVEDVRLSCGLCNPAMMAAADIVADWARGRTLDAILGLDATSPAALAPFFEQLGGPGEPADAREKFQYALLAVQNAVRDHRGEPTIPVPEIPVAEIGEPDDRAED